MSPNMRRLAAPILAIVLALPLPLVPAAAGDDPPLLPLVGSLHEHSGYSDGYPGSTPGTYYASARSFGLDFLGSGEHSDNSRIPVVLSEECLSEAVATCVGGDPDPVKSLTKWEATLEYARAATDASFTGFRGFEWTSDRFGHINVYFSRNDANAKIDGGYEATMETFYQWFRTRPEYGGGSDGLATFNHPGDKCNLGDSDPGCDWNDFAYVPDADDRMVGIEVYNDRNEYGTSRGPAGGYYAHVLDKGWHVGPVGAEDLGHERDDDWGGPGWAKTVVLAPDRSEASLRAAMLARRFYAVRTTGLRMTYTLDGEQMGSRITRVPGSPLALEASINDPALTLEVVTSGAAVVATGTGSVSTALAADPGQRYYFVRARRGSEYVAYSAPVWVSAAGFPEVGEWLAGDLHVHTCYSHDAWCPPEDSNTGPEDFYTLSGSVEERFIEASARGLDYLAITDHHSDGRPEESGADAWKDPGFGTHGVIGVPGYENSISGHAQMLGATRVYPSGDGSIAAIDAMADALRADGGVFQANHPADNTYLLGRPFTCSDTSYLHWQYGYDVRVDTVEIWNISNLLQPPAPAGTSNEDAIAYWECWLQSGAHVGATGGSDSHWISTSALQGPGNPTTWVFARERSAAGVLAAVREGRTSVSLLPPVEGAVRLLLEGDADGDGTYEAMIGDTVPPGTPMRVRALGAPDGGVVQVRANGATIVDDAPLAPGGSVTFTAPSAAGWVRATLRAPEAMDARTAACDPAVGWRTTYCRNHLTTIALTSAIYLAT